MEDKKKRTPWIFWPFVALWDLITWILKLTGRLVAAILASSRFVKWGMLGRGQRVSGVVR